MIPRLLNAPTEEGARIRFLALPLMLAMATVAPAADELVEEARQLRAKQAEEQEKLAAWCDSQGLAPQANDLRSDLVPRSPFMAYLPVLPEKVGRPPLPDGAPANLVEFERKLVRLKYEHSNDLYEMARRAIRARRAALAYELALLAIHVNPDHEAVRRIFGYQKYHDRWRTFWEVRQLRAGKVWHEQFGWLLKTHVRRYEEGMRFNGRNWVTALQDASLRQDIRHGWIVETEHYSVQTNHSLEAGVKLGAKLETLFRVWQQLFMRYYASQSDVLALFDGRARKQRTQMPRFSVVFFRDREDYNRSLRAAMPNIGMSLGVYVEQTRRAYFFAGEDYEDRTLFHEATHQLFHQSRPVRVAVGRHANFWIVEGVALYVETLRRRGDYYTLGGFDDDRLYAAQYRLLNDNFYVPFEEFTRYGMQQLQGDPRIATLYSQAAGQACFLVHYDGGRYRDALVAYLDAVYAGRDTPNTLSELTGTSYDELDKQYRKFIESSVKAAKP